MSSNVKRPRRRRRIIVAGIVAAVLAGIGGGTYLYVKSFREVIPGRVYRSGQPSQKQLEAEITSHGIKTVFNLRGDTAPDAAWEQATAERMGVKFGSVKLSAQHSPSWPLMMQLIEAIESAQTPVLLHCRDGVDRSGLGAMLAAMAIGGQDYDTARAQLYTRPVRLFGGSGHISDVMKLYEDDCRQKGIGHGDWQQFRRWAAEQAANAPAETQPAASGGEE